jgi:TRAP transporter TAXI family solute receptor
MKCDSCKIWIPVVILVIISLVIAYQFVEPAPPKTIRIATGRIGGGYHTFALKYKELLAKDNFQLEIVPTAGSIEVLQRLKSGDVSVGLVQGGTGNSVSPDGLKSLGSLFYEPLWVFHHREQPVEYLFDLRGKRVAVGEEGSGTRPLALQLLADNQVTPENTTFFNLSSKKAAQQLMAGEIDAAFFVMSPTASVISELLQEPTIKLLNFTRHLAYTSQYSFLSSVKLGQGVIDLEQNIPNEEKILLAATASLVAREDLHSDLVHLLLMKAEEVHRPGGLLEKVDQFPSTQFVEFPMNKNAAVYLKEGPSFLHKIFPFWIAATIARLTIMIIPLLAVMMPLFKSAPPIYRWRIRSQIYRWYVRLYEVDRELDQITDLEALAEKIKEIKLLEKEVIGQVSVPLSFMGELYSLHVHIRLVLSRLEEQRQEILKAVS